MNSYLIKGPVTTEIIAAEIYKLGSRKDTGGHSIFLGQVRDDAAGDMKVKAIEYSAYEEMVRVEAEKIREIILNEYTDVLSIIMFHSVGIVNAGEISLFILVSAGHRDHATRACRKLVELIKERLPIWKKELLENNSHRWKQNK
jgi:molybdopterin synthase catalytic subunit